MLKQAGRVDPQIEYRKPPVDTAVDLFERYLREIHQNKVSLQTWDELNTRDVLMLSPVPSNWTRSEVQEVLARDGRSIVIRAIFNVLTEPVFTDEILQEAWDLVQLRVLMES